MNITNINFSSENIDASNLATGPYKFLGVLPYDVIVKIAICMVIVNLIIYLLTMKKEKRSKALYRTIIMSIIIGIVFVLLTFNDYIEINVWIIIVNVLLPIFIIIQLIIIFKLIINIVKNKKKEENLKCQE